jgi:hypothetical protein
MVLWSGIGIITVTFFTLTIFSISDVWSLNNVYTFFVVSLTFNLVFDTICTVMVTLAIIKISKISGMLPSHIKHSKAMIWSHIVLFNLFNIVELVVVALNWWYI